MAAAFPKRPSALLETERQPYQAHFNMDRHPRIQPAVYSISVNGPYDAKGRATRPAAAGFSSARRRKPSEEEGCAKTHSLDADAPRVSPAGDRCGSCRSPLKFYQGGARRTADFEAGIEMALRAVLVSPEFLFRVEQDPAGCRAETAYRISDLELASRLSFFLWSSIPDDELLDAGRSSGKLQNAGGAGTAGAADAGGSRGRRRW